MTRMAQQSGWIGSHEAIARGLNEDGRLRTVQRLRRRQSAGRGDEHGTAVSAERGVGCLGGRGCERAHELFDVRGRRASFPDEANKGSELAARRVGARPVHVRNAGKHPLELTPKPLGQQGVREDGCR